MKASNTDMGDEFGRSVAISGDLAVVGTALEDSASRGINGNEADNAALDSGAAYVFQRQLGTWRQVAYLKASNADTEDHFGWSVAISGETIVIGAPQESGSAVGINGSEHLNNSLYSGAVYVFEYIAGTWMQTAYVKASNTDIRDRFGSAIGIDGDWLAVGAPHEDSDSTGAQSGVSSSGAAYMFRRTGGVWSQVAFVKASNAGWADLFGQRLAISGDRLVVGAPGEASSSSGVNGNQADNSLGYSGAAYIFDYVGGAWGQVAYLKAQYPGEFDSFGFAVDVSGDQVVVGAFSDGSNAVGIDGDGSNDLRLDSGAAYIFHKQGATWTQAAYLKAHNASVDALFGYTVAIDGNRVVIGAAAESFYGPNGTLSSIGVSVRSGSAYLFERVGGTWSQLRYQKADPFGHDDIFSFSLAISGNRVVVGALNEDGASTGIGGDPNSNSTAGSGAAYLFDFNPVVESICDPAVANSTGASGVILVNGSEITAINRFYLGAAQLPPFSFGYFISSLGQGAIPMSGGSQGTLCVGGGTPIARHQGTIRQSSDFGFIFAQIDLTAMPLPTGFRPVAPGETWYFQCWYRDMNPTNATNYTNAVSVRFD